MMAKIRSTGAYIGKCLATVFLAKFLGWLIALLCLFPMGFLSSDSWIEPFLDIFCAVLVVFSLVVCYRHHLFKRVIAAIAFSYGCYKGVISVAQIHHVFPVYPVIPMELHRTLPSLALMICCFTLMLYYLAENALISYKSRQ